MLQMAQNSGLLLPRPGLMTLQQGMADPRIASIIRGPRAGLCTGMFVGLNAGCDVSEPYVPPTTNLVLNLDASTQDGVRFPGASGDGQPIDLWTDQHSSGNDFQMTTIADRPTWIANAQNGLGAVNFLHTSTQWLEANAFIAGSSPGHIFMVHKTTSAQIVNNGWMRFGSPALDSHYTLSASISIYSSFGSTTRKGPVNATNYGTWHLSEIHSESADWAYIHNGVTKLTDGANIKGWDATAFAFRLGRSQTIYYTGEMGQVIIFDAKKTGADLIDVREGLSARWDLGF